MEYILYINFYSDPKYSDFTNISDEMVSLECREIRNLEKP
jgi:hypothetical protein